MARVERPLRMDKQTFGAIHWGHVDASLYSAKRRTNRPAVEQAMIVIKAPKPPHGTTSTSVSVLFEGSQIELLFKAAKLEILGVVLLTSF